MTLNWNQEGKEWSVLINGDSFIHFLAGRKNSGKVRIKSEIPANPSTYLLSYILVHVF